MSDSMFQVIEQGKFGDTLTVENPKLSAYKHMACLHVIGIRSGLLIHEDCYTVQSEKNGRKLADITFQPEEV